MYTYKPKGTCSQEFAFDIEGDVIKRVSFKRGCTGNLTGVARLLEGMEVRTAIDKLKGIQCQNGTSCPDQISIALTEYLGKR